MSGEEYLNAVRLKFCRDAVQFDSPDMFVAYEEEFRVEWIATKLKINSFVRVVPSITRQEFQQYSQWCLDRALAQSRGLPRGLQNGIVSYSVLVSEHPDPDALMLATQRPAKHYAAFEMPVIFDTHQNNLYFYYGSIFWGKLYESFLRDYLVGHFYPFQS